MAQASENETAQPRESNSPTNLGEPGEPTDLPEVEPVELPPLPPCEHEPKDFLKACKVYLEDTDWRGKPALTTSIRAQELHRKSFCSIANVVACLREAGELTKISVSEFHQDIMPYLAWFTSLDELALQAGPPPGEPIRDIGPVRALKNLERLSVTGAKGIDLAPVAHLTKLTSLRISGPVDEPIRGEVSSASLEFLRNLTRLEYLTLIVPEVDDLEPLRGLTRLRSLSLRGSKIRNLSPLESLRQLEGLALYDGTQISDVTVVQHLPRLQDLSLQGTQVSDLRPLAGHPALDSVGLSRTPVHDLNLLATLPTLKYLYIDGTQVTDLSPLTACQKLIELDISATAVSDFSVLSKLTLLRALHANETSLHDLRVIRNLKRLNRLHLMGTPVQDLSPLAGLTKMEFLDLRSTRVSDFTPLMQLDKLTKVDLRGSRVRSLEALRRHIPDDVWQEFRPYDHNDLDPNAP